MSHKKTKLHVRHGKSVSWTDQLKSRIDQISASRPGALKDRAQLLAQSGAALSDALSPGSYVSRDVMRRFSWVLELAPTCDEAFLLAPPAGDNWTAECIAINAEGGLCRLRLHPPTGAATQVPVITLAIDGVFETPQTTTIEPSDLGGLDVSISIPKTPLTRLRICGQASDGVTLLIETT